jgi:hypothetical protein
MIKKKKKNEKIKSEKIDKKNFITTFDKYLENKKKPIKK